MVLEQIKFNYLVSRISGTWWRLSLNFLRDYHKRSQCQHYDHQKELFCRCTYVDNHPGITMTYRFILRIFAFNWTLQVGRFTVARINIAGFAFSTCHLLPARSSRFHRINVVHRVRSQHSPNQNFNNVGRRPKACPMARAQRMRHASGCLDLALLKTMKKYQNIVTGSQERKWG